MKKIPIAQNTIQETLLIPLYARALGSELFPQILYDPLARESMAHLDYDFAALTAKKQTRIWQFGALEGILRSRDMLFEMKEYLAAHPGAAIVNLGCGLDTTPRLVATGNSKIYNIDRDDVMNLRQQILPLDDRDCNLSADLRDPSWLQVIDGAKGVFLFAAGVFMYLQREEVETLLRNIRKAFPTGTLVFDTVGKAGVQILMKCTLQTMGIYYVDGLFYANHPLQDILWPEGCEVNVRPYLTGYVNLRKEGVPPLLRWAAFLFDHLFHMRICQMRW